MPSRRASSACVNFAAVRARRDGAGIDRAVREAAGLEPELAPEQAELLRFVARMTDAAERRDLPDAAAHTGAPAAFPPCRRRIRPVGPARAARLWLARLHALKGPPRDTGTSMGAARSDSAIEAHRTDAEETGDVTHLPTQERGEPQTPRPGRAEMRDAA